MARNYKEDEKSDSECSTKKWKVRINFKPGDIGYLTCLHGSVYEKEYGYDCTFEAYVAKGLAEFIHSFNPKKERIWIVEINSKIIGFIAVVKKFKQEAQLRWFFVHPNFRGLGIGKYLIFKAIEFCKQRKYKTISLWTTSELKTAHYLYTYAGFKKTEEKNHKIWGKRVTEERYELLI